MADYYTTMANMKKAAREDDMAAKNGNDRAGRGRPLTVDEAAKVAGATDKEGKERIEAIQRAGAEWQKKTGYKDEEGKKLSESIQSVGRGAQLAAMKESERAKAMEKGAAVSAKLKGGPLLTKTVTGPAKRHRGYYLPESDGSGAAGPAKK
jgi:hypothetical protein